MYRADTLTVNFVRHTKEQRTMMVLLLKQKLPHATRCCLLLSREGAAQNRRAQPNQGCLIYTSRRCLRGSWFACTLEVIFSPTSTRTNVQPEVSARTQRYYSRLEVWSQCSMSQPETSSASAPVDQYGLPEGLSTEEGERETGATPLLSLFVPLRLASYRQLLVN